MGHLNIFVETLLQETGKLAVTLEKKKYNKTQTAQDMLKLVRSKVKINLFFDLFRRIRLLNEKQPAKYRRLTNSFLVLGKGLADKNNCVL